MKRESAQVSMEYMAVMGFVLLITVPLLIIFFQQSSAARDQVNADKAGQIVRQIADAADQVYYLGEPSTRTIKVSMPERVKQVIILDREVTLRIETDSGDTDVVGVSSVNMTGSFSTAAGLQKIKVQATDNGVTISNT